MRKIYLASDSKARKELLTVLGLKIKVVPSRLQETKKSKHLSFAALVKQNALQKAKKVGAGVGNGIVIAADTVVVQGTRVFGKPKDLLDARRMLRRLSARPQLVYTGIAVVDTKHKKTLVDYEKTRVYMDRLCDKEISAYFSRVSPLDKAGSFDIQGRGAFFIRRIEGCFYTVVGLPVRKLYRMLKKIGVEVF